MLSSPTALQHLPYRAQELVSQLPFAAGEHLLVGGKDSRVFEIALSDGRILRTVSSAGECTIGTDGAESCSNLNSDPRNGGERAGTNGDDNSNADTGGVDHTGPTIWIGRTDHSVTAYDTTRRSQLWNLTYSELAPPDAAMLMLASIASASDRKMNGFPSFPSGLGSASAGGSTASAASLRLQESFTSRLSLVTTMQGEVIAADADSGAFAWQSARLDAPISAIYAVGIVDGISSVVGGVSSSVSTASPSVVQAPVPFHEVWPALKPAWQPTAATPLPSSDGKPASNGETRLSVVQPPSSEVFIGVLPSGELYAAPKTSRTVVMPHPTAATGNGAAADEADKRKPAINPIDVSELPPGLAGLIASGSFPGSNGDPMHLADPSLGSSSSSASAVSSVGHVLFLPAPHPGELDPVEAAIEEEFRQQCSARFRGGLISSGGDGDGASGFDDALAQAQCMVGLHNVTFLVDPGAMAQLAHLPMPARQWLDAGRGLNVPALPWAASRPLGQGDVGSGNTITISAIPVGSQAVAVPVLYEFAQLIGSVTGADPNDDEQVLVVYQYLLLASAAVAIATIAASLLFAYRLLQKRNGKKRSRGGAKGKAGTSTTAAATPASPAPEGAAIQAAAPAVLASSNASTAVIDGVQYRVVGRLAVSSTVLGYGSHGTIVFSGLWDSRPVAVKRMLRNFHPAATREISLLIKSDGHPNVVRYYSMEDSDPDFLYLALELCEGSLAEAIEKCARQRQKAANKAATGGSSGSKPKSKSLALLQSSSNSDDDDDHDDGSSISNPVLSASALSGGSMDLQTVPVPTPPTRAFLRDIASGVAHLHAHRIVHRDLKPHNILLAKHSSRNSSTNSAAAGAASNVKPNASKSASNLELMHSLYPEREHHTLGILQIPKISDFGLGKQLDVDSSSFGAVPHHGGTSVDPRHLSSGFQAQVSRRHQAFGTGGTVDASSSSAVAPGSIGWQAPEVIIPVLRSRSAVAAAALPQLPEIPEMDGAADDDGVDATPGAGGSALPAVSARTPASDASSSNNDSNTVAFRRSRAADVWSLGCLLYSVIDAGNHPYGESYQRESNIVLDTHNLSRIEHLPEAHSLISAMIRQDPSKRPTAAEVLEHLFFWSDEKRLQFLCDLSDRLEREAEGSPLIAALEITAGRTNVIDVTGSSGPGWSRRLPAALLADVGKYRRYSYFSFADLLRLFRNKRNHFGDLPSNVRKDIIGCDDAVGLVPFFLSKSRFPKLLITAYEFTLGYLSHEPAFTSHIGSQTASKHAAAASAEARAFAKAKPAPGGSSSDAAQSSKAGRRWYPDEAGWLQAAASISERVTTSTGGLLLTATVDESSNHGSADSAGGMVMVVAAYDRVKETRYAGGAHARDARYKSKPCKDWDQNAGAFCPRGARCDFAHGQIELRAASSSVSVLSVPMGAGGGTSSAGAQPGTSAGSTAILVPSAPLKPAWSSGTAGLGGLKGT